MYIDSIAAASRITLTMHSLVGPFVANCDISPD